MRLPLVTPSYVGRSLNVTSSRTINCYAEAAPEDAKSSAFLIGTPGTILWTSVGPQPIRGAHVFGGLLYVVAGHDLYSITSAGSVSVSLGTLLTVAGRVGMADNGLTSAGVGGNQLMIIDGIGGYVYNVQTASFSTISGGGWPGNPISLAYMDTYFIVGVAGSMQMYCSDPYDATTWGTLAVASAMGLPDTVQAVFNMQQQLWVIKQYTSEVWYDTGTATSVGFPFSRMSGAVLDYGTAAPWSCARGANSLFFLAQEREGDAGEMIGVVQILGQDFTPTPITPPAIVWQWSQYGSAVDAFGYCYSMEGHTFYVLTFPSANATWVYDATVKLWHERSTYIPGSPYQVYRHVGNCYALFNGMHLLGDYEAGNIYQMRSDAYTDNGSPIVSVRTMSPLWDKDKSDMIFLHRLYVDMKTGMGSVNPANITLSWSTDGGHIFTRPYAASIGAIGQYATRAVWRRLGTGRDFTFRLEISDPVERVLMIGYVE